MRLTSILSVVTTCLIAAFTVGCMQLQPLSAPTFQVASTDSRKVHEAVKDALLNRRWAIIAQRANGFDAEYQRSADTRARIRITHSGNKVSITYLDSQNLDYTTANGSAEIHKTYNSWVANLERDIAIEVGKRL